MNNELEIAGLRAEIIDLKKRIAFIIDGVDEWDFNDQFRYASDTSKPFIGHDAIKALEAMSRDEYAKYEGGSDYMEKIHAPYKS